MLIIIAALAAHTLTANASAIAPRIVYGTDNRQETYQATQANQNLAQATAGMFRKTKGIDFGAKIMLNPYTLGKTMRLCEGERFSTQPRPMSCSGFLVGPDLLVTAGHCIQTQADCEGVSWAFDFKLDSSNGRAPVMLDKKQVYNCKSVIEAKEEKSPDGESLDYSLIRLDRPVLNRSPLRFRKYGKIKQGQGLVMIGHPSGLPQKITAGGIVVGNETKNTFVTNLDAFGGNSGSAVFNEDSGAVEGILVSGAEDYQANEEKGCTKVNTTDFLITDFQKYGENVTRISVVKTLQFRSNLIASAKSGNFATFKMMADQIPTPNVYDNRFNTALHFAAANNNLRMIQYLVKRGADLTEKNMRKKTAYDVANALGYTKAANLLRP